MKHLAGFFAVICAITMAGSMTFNDVGGNMPVLGRVAADYSLPCTETVLLHAGSSALEVGQTATITNGVKDCNLIIVYNFQVKPTMYQMCIHDVDPTCNITVKQRFYGVRTDKLPAGTALKCACLNRWFEMQITYRADCSGGFKVTGYELDQKVSCDAFA